MTEKRREIKTHTPTTPNTKNTTQNRTRLNS
jgi:hypothetical protein